MPQKISSSTDQWQPYLHDLGECEGKHGERLHVVNLYNDEIGNPAVPTKCGRNRDSRNDLVFCCCAEIAAATRLWRWRSVR